LKVVDTLKTLEEYLDALESRNEGKPDQVKEGMALYLDLWRKVIDRGLVDPRDEVDVAVEKVEKAGGLYEAAGEEKG
jgi:hypothetical protein